MNTNEQNVIKDTLLDELEELIYQCKNRFSNRYELATENEEIVGRLCTCLQRILAHGLRNNHKPKKLLNGILTVGSSSVEKDSLWRFLGQFLTEHETQRFLLLRCVQTDKGRSSSWIRNALNEHSFERYIAAILADRSDRRSIFYHQWALLRDEESCRQLLSQLSQLNTILFALNIDNADLDADGRQEATEHEPSLGRHSYSQSSSSEHGSNRSTDVNTSHSISVTPSSSSNRHIGREESERPTRKGGDARRDCKQLLVPNSAKRSHFVTINDSTECFNDSDDCENYARSAPNTSFLDHSPVGFSTPASLFRTASPSTASVTDGPPISNSELVASSSSKPTLPTSATSLKPEERTSLPPPGKSSSSSSLNVVADSSGMVLFPICDQDSPPHLSIEVGSHAASSASSLLPEEARKRLVGLEGERDKLDRENTLLKIQLKKYIAAIELLKFNRIVAEENVKADEEPSEQSQNYIRDYENKLVKVSQMHGELVEFNDYLYKVIQQKDSIIARLRDELVELRGPLPETEDIMSQSGEGEQQSSLQSLVQIPLIHIWIPTAFLSGGFKGKSHHIYQIYIRIKEEEWNVYRRYSQFYSLHKTLKNTHRPVGEFDFPPKKAIGNKDSKVVQERRKKLEFYLRNVINHLQSINSDITNKDKLVQVIPFLSDKFFLQDRSHSETNLAQQSQSTTATQSYMGF